MKTALRTAFLLLLLTASARAAPLNVLVIDAGHTMTGTHVSRWLSAVADMKVTTLDLAQLRGVPAPTDGVVVWIAPQPALFTLEAGGLFAKVRHDPNVGLMIVGIEEADADANWMMDVLRARVDAIPGNVLGKHLVGANWIWAGKPQDNAAVVLQKTFELDEVPTRTWLQIAADNSATVWVNDVQLGECHLWRQPASLDASKAMRKGKNVIRIDAFNEDGPGGVVASLQGRRPDGSEVVHVVTDATWQAQAQVKGEAKPQPWKPATVIAKLEGGPWENKVETSYGSDIYRIQPDGASPITAGLDDTLGNCVVLKWLAARGNGPALLKADGMPVALAAERTIIFAGDPEKTTGANGLLESAAFAKFVQRSVLYLGKLRSKLQIIR